MAFLRAIGPMHAVAVHHAGARLRQVTVPDLVGALGQRDALPFASPAFVEDAQLDLLRVLRKEREIDALAVPGCAARIGVAGPDDGNARRLPVFFRNNFV